MPAKITEKFILTGNPEVQVDLWDNGTVEVLVGSEIVTVERLSQIVTFVERHAQVTVSAND